MRHDLFMSGFFSRLPSSEQSFIWLAVFFPVNIFNLLRVAVYWQANRGSSLPRDWWVAFWTGVASIALLVLLGVLIWLFLKLVSPYL